MRNINLLVVDDHQLLRKSLVSLLSFFPINLDFFEASNGSEALNVVATESIDLVLLDMQMPTMNGMECLKKLKKNFPSVKVIMLTQFDEPSLVVSLVHLGADSFLLKDCDPNELEKAIFSVLENGRYFNQTVKDILKGIAGEDGKKAIEFNFSPREIQVARLLKAGFSSKEIADELELALFTVDSYRKSLMKKANCKNVAELLRVLYETGIISK